MEDDERRSRGKNKELYRKVITSTIHEENRRGEEPRNLAKNRNAEEGTEGMLMAAQE